MNAGVWLRLGRVSNLPTVWSNVLAALALSGESPGAASVLGLLLAMSLFYSAGMYLNDAFDRHIDARERPERPIPSGKVGAATVFTAGFSMLMLGALLTLVAAWNEAGATAHRAGLSAVALGACIVFYDVYHKQNPLSPLVMGLCRVLVYVTVALAASSELARPVWLGAAALLCHLIGLSYAAKQETLARLKSLWPLVFLAAAPAYGAYLALARPEVWPFWVLYVAFSLYALSFLLRSARRSIPGAVVRLIAAIALLDAVLIAASGAWVLASVAAGLCAMTRLFQRVIPGT
ncbi:MAG TPA: UbiA family prenyltransferase [Polyangiaceae bacterium]